jgi:hypothetical protein
MAELTGVFAVFGVMDDRYAGETRAGEPFGTTPYMAPELRAISEETATYKLVGDPRYFAVEADTCPIGFVLCFLID